MSATKVVFIDLGANDGQSSEMFLKQMEGSPYDVTAHCVEPNPVMAQECWERLSPRPQVYTYELAISSKPGPVKLYFQPDDCVDRHGSSLYADKRNVTEKCVDVPTMPFSTFFAEVNQLGAVVLLKANIEGSEYDLVMDMEKHGLFEEVDILLGVRGIGKWGAGGGWVADMAKTPSLVPKIPEVVEILKRNGKRPVVFSSALRKESVNARELVDAVVRDRSGLR